MLQAGMQISVRLPAEPGLCCHTSTRRPTSSETSISARWCLAALATSLPDRTGALPSHRVSTRDEGRPGRCCQQICGCVVSVFLFLTMAGAILLVLDFLVDITTAVVVTGFARRRVLGALGRPAAARARNRAGQLARKAREGNHTI